MTKAKQLLTFEDYLNSDDGTDQRYELVDGELRDLPPESELNNFLATWLQFELAKLIGLRRIKVHTCEIQVPVLQSGDAQNRFPDLVILRPEHLMLTQKRLTITLDMPPPLLVAEVVSPGQINRERDFRNKRDQYCKREIPEYWLIDPEHQAITVLELEADHYTELGTFNEDTPIRSRIFPDLQLTAQQLFSAAE